ncbi:MAG: Trk system potassium transporter TrkA [Myxococcales bacterium]|nr:Trk system potassium transporter TrkA [Myxococcales bacterium]
MRIVIVGAGVVGSNLAEELSNSGHAVSVVDAGASIIRRLDNRMDVLCVRGNGAQPSVLRRAGIDDAEMCIAVTSTDEVNVVISMLARKFGVKHKIARLRSDEYVGPDAMLRPEELGIDTAINPESIIVQTLSRIVDIPGAIDASTFAEGQVLLVTFNVEEGAPVVGKRLAELRSTAEASFLIVAVFRGERPIVPRGDDRLMVNDHVAVITRCDTIDTMVPLFVARPEPVRRVVVYGATLVGVRLVRELHSSKKKLERVVLIEPDEDRAEQAAAELSNDTLVLHGEASDPEVLREAIADHCDFFFAMSRDDESNMLAALMARRHNAHRVAVLSQEPHYVPVLSNIGLDVVLNPRLVAVGEILKFIRRGAIHMVTRLRDSEAEVMELEAVPGSQITKHPIKEIEFPHGGIIGAVLRDGEMLIPNGDCQIVEGETCVVFALPEAIKRLEKLFSRKRLFG